MDDKKIYAIAGTQWYQSQLTYEELGKALDIVSGFSESFVEQKSFGEIAKQAYERGLVPSLFRVALKPYHPDVRSFITHWFYRLLYRIDRNNLAKPLTPEEIFAILGDFFFINTSWIENLTNLNDGSGVKSRALMMIQALMGGIFPPMISPLSSPGATSTPSTPQSNS
jgi:hypothetical protein